MSTHYATLGLSPQSVPSKQQIKQQFRLLALRWHPDRNPGNEARAAERFKAVQEAFEVLSDPERRAAPPDIESRRVGIYRDLIYNNIESFLSGGFPVLRSLYSDERWHALVRDFVRDHVSHSPYFLETSGRPDIRSPSGSASSSSSGVIERNFSSPSTCRNGGRIGVTERQIMMRVLRVTVTVKVRVKADVGD